LNFHGTELDFKHGSLLHNIFNPVTSLRSRLDLAYLRRYSSEYEGLSGEIHRFDAARDIHEKLSHLLGDKRVFFEQPQEELKEPDAPQSEVVVTSLDLVAWAYLKEELVNTADAEEVKYLKAHFKNLVHFVEFMDAYITKKETPLAWNNSSDFANKIVNSL